MPENTGRLGITHSKTALQSLGVHRLLYENSDAQINDPLLALDIANKKYVDDITTVFNGSAAWKALALANGFEESGFNLFQLQRQGQIVVFSLRCLNTNAIVAGAPKALPFPPGFRPFSTYIFCGSVNYTFATEIYTDGSNGTLNIAANCPAGGHIIVQGSFLTNNPMPAQ
jgi:hypothetical protein